MLPHGQKDLAGQINSYNCFNYNYLLYVIVLPSFIFTQFELYSLREKNMDIKITDIKEAVETVVLKKYMLFTGRSGRREFWLYFLAYFALSIVFGIIVGILPFLSILGIAFLGILLPTIAVGIRRMHDIDKSGWFMLIPFYNLYLATLEGTKGSNQYGEEPKE